MSTEEAPDLDAAIRFAQDEEAARLRRIVEENYGPMPDERATERSPALLESLLQAERGIRRADEAKATARLDALGDAVDLCIEIYGPIPLGAGNAALVEKALRVLEKARIAGVAERTDTGWRRVPYPR